MKLTDDQRTHMRQTFAQMRAEIQVLQQSMENAPRIDAQLYGHSYGDAPTCKYELDEYLLSFRIGNISDLSMHLLELLKLVKA